MVLPLPPCLPLEAYDLLLRPAATDSRACAASRAYLAPHPEATTSKAYSLTPKLAVLSKACLTLQSLPVSPRACCHAESVPLPPEIACQRFPDLAVCLDFRQEFDNKIEGGWVARARERARAGWQAGAGQ